MSKDTTGACFPHTPRHTGAGRSAQQWQSYAEKLESDVQCLCAEQSRLRAQVRLLERVVEGVGDPDRVLRSDSGRSMLHLAYDQACNAAKTKR